MRMIGAETRIVASTSQASTAVGEDEAVILELDRGTYFGVSGVAATIWALAQEPRSVREIADTVVREYDVEPDRCLDDTVRFIDDLIENGLAEVIDPRP